GGTAGGRGGGGRGVGGGGGRGRGRGGGRGWPGTGDAQPRHDQQEAGQERLDLAAGGLGMPGGDEVGELGQAGQQRDQPPGAGGAWSDAPGDAERGDLHPPQRQQRGGRRRHRDADRDGQDVCQAERQVAGEERDTGKGHRRQRRAEQEEQAEAQGDARDSGGARFDRGDHRDLPRRRADQAYRGEPLLPARRRQPGRGTDEDQHGEQQRRGNDRQDE